MQQTNKTFEVHGYEDTTARTEINFNDEIVFQQIDIADVKVLYRHGIIYIEGYIRHQDQINSENILKLNQWSRERGDSNKWLKKTTIKIVRGDYVIRHLIFNAFIVDYLEYFNKGKHRFTLVLRQYKLARLDGTRGETGAVKMESYIKHMTLKDVENTVIITPLEPIDYDDITIKSVLSSSNMVTAYGMKQMLSMANHIALKFFLIAHGTGLISEFIADVYFVATGNTDKMGSFNLTRDHFYKPLGEIVKKAIETRKSPIYLSDTFGEDIYNTGNLAFSIAELGKIGLKHIHNIKDNNGLGYIFSITVKNVKTSTYGRVLKPVKFIGLTPIKATLKLIEEMGLDSYSIGKTTQGEINKRKDKER